MNRITMMSKSLTLTLLLSFSYASFALPFVITPKAGTTLPTSVSSGSKVTAYYTVSNNTMAARNNNYVKFLPPNTRQITTNATYPDTCGEVFNLTGKGQPGDSCTLQLSISGPISSTDPRTQNHLFVCFPGGLTCAGTPFPLNVSQGEISRTVGAYVTDFSQGIVFNCPVENGNFGTCTEAGNQFSSGGPTGVALNPQRTFAYIANTTTPFIYYCPINSDGSFGNCGPTGDQISGAIGLAINPAGTFAYILNISANTVAYCAIDPAGFLLPCSLTGNIFHTPIGIVINKAGTYAYISNSNSVSGCAIDALTGGLINCTLMNDPAFGFNYAITMNQAETILYITQGNANVIYCPINPDHSLGACQPTGNGSGFPIGIAINKENTFAFISNLSSNEVQSCPINPNGTFGICTPTSQITTASGIALF